MYLYHIYNLYYFSLYILTLKQADKFCMWEYTWQLKHGDWEGRGAESALYCFQMVAWLKIV